MSRHDAQLAAWRKANPFILCNVQSSQSLCGRFPTLEAAKAEAERRGGCVGVEGCVVLFSEMPRL